MHPEPLSPELALVDADAARAARAALPPVELYEDRLLQAPPAVPAVPVSPISAELALVDADAAEAARAALPPVELYEDRLLHPAPAVPEPLHAVAVDPPVTIAPLVTAEGEPRARRRSRSHAAVAIAATVAVLASLGVVLAGDSSGRTVRAAPDPPAKTTPTTTVFAPPGVAKLHTATTEAPPPSAKARAPAPRTTAKTAAAATTPAAPAKTANAKPANAKPANAQPRNTPGKAPGKSTVATAFLPDFVWVAPSGVREYRIEFSAGSRVALRTEVGEARFRVRRAQLPPGHYRWRVWALDARGRAQPTPLVDATVEIS